VDADEQRAYLAKEHAKKIKRQETARAKITQALSRNVPQPQDDPE
jgi:hypothetical protein